MTGDDAADRVHHAAHRPRSGRPAGSWRTLTSSLDLDDGDLVRGRGTERPCSAVQTFERSSSESGCRLSLTASRRAEQHGVEDLHAAGRLEDGRDDREVVEDPHRAAEQPVRDDLVLKRVRPAAVGRAVGR